MDNKELITVNEETGEIQVAREVVNRIAEAEAQEKQAKETMKEMKKIIQDGMEKYGLTKLDAPNLLVTYVPESETLRFNQTKFKEEHLKEYNEYCEVKPRSAYVRITARNNG